MQRAALCVDVEMTAQSAAISYDVTLSVKARDSHLRSCRCCDARTVSDAHCVDEHTLIRDEHACSHRDDCTVERDVYGEEIAMQPFIDA